MTDQRPMSTPEQHSRSEQDNAKEATGASQPVVVGVDGSPASDQALLFAAREAQIRGAVLHIVAAYDMTTVSYGFAGGFGMGLDLGAMQEGQRRAGEALVKAAADTVAAQVVGHQVPVQTIVSQGRPSQVLLDAATGAGLLVVGARGAGAWTRLMLGSTSTEVVHHAQLPVTVVPSGDTHGTPA